MAYAEYDIAFEGLSVHCYRGGKSGLAVLLLHGSGPGASSIGNWRSVMDALAERYQCVAVDLIGFGGSSFKNDTPYFDIDMWLRQCRLVMASMPVGPIGIIGHSLSASLALQLASETERVAGVLTTGAMGAKFAVNEATKLCWTFPETREDLKKTAEVLIYRKDLIDDVYLSNRMQILYENAKYGRYFTSMFAGDKQKYADASVVSDQALERVKCTVKMLHGRDDVGFPPANTISIAAKLSSASVTLIPDCSHSVAMEHPDLFLAAAKRLFG